MAKIRVTCNVPDGDFCDRCPNYRDLSGYCNIFGEYLGGAYPGYRRCDKCKKAEIKKPEKLLPCKCGGKRRRLWHATFALNPNNMWYECLKCGYESNYYCTKKELRKGWNNEMRALKEEGKTL